MEVVIAAFILIFGLLTLFAMLDVANHANLSNRGRQTATSLVRELLEDARSLRYNQLPAGSLASALQPLVSGSSVSGTNLVMQRQGLTFTAAFTACSLDDPADGYGSHSLPPASGGSWCPDVAPSGTSDSQPDDLQRVSATVTAAIGTRTVSQTQTELIYNAAVNGPAVTCISSTTTCPGSSQTVSDPAPYNLTTSMTFNITSTAPMAEVQWLVNGNPAPSGQIPSGASDPYAASGTTSSFTWLFPPYDGTFTISAVAYDANGNAGSRASMQVTLNRHPVIAPTSFVAGWNPHIGAVDIQWVPSVDQDVSGYDVFRSVNGGAPTPVVGCQNISGTSCIDIAAAAPIGTLPATCSSRTSTYASVSNVYYVVGVDSWNGTPRVSTAQSPSWDANDCDHIPNPPTGLSGWVSGGALNLNWTPPSPTDADAWDSVIPTYRLYRWAAAAGATPPGLVQNSRYQVVGGIGAGGATVATATDSSPDPGGAAQNYCVTSVDNDGNESACSNVVNG